MGKVNTTLLEKAFSQFEKMYEQYKSGVYFDGSIEQEAIKESLVQRFEYTTELAWKTLARFIEEEFGLDIVKAPKPVFREAGKLEILETELWIEFVDGRNKSSHMYNENMLESVLKCMDSFYVQSKKLLDYFSNYKG